MPTPIGLRRSTRRLEPVAGRLAVAAAGLALGGCASPPACDRACVSQKVEARFGASVLSAAPTGAPLVPQGVSLGRPIAEDQAVLLALWNNALFQESLVELQLTRADLIGAGLLPNPEFVYYWPVSEKPLKYLADFPIESLFLRPVRIKIAEAENARACERLTQLALDLIRDTRQAYADLRLARTRVAVAAEAVELRGRIAALADARLKAGDASVQEAATARTDALIARQDAARIGFEVTLAEERLRNLLGLSGVTDPLLTDDAPADLPATPPDREDLVRVAVDTRPDAVAAAHATRAAAERVRFARIGWFRLLGIADATSGRASGHELGPALRVTVPIFNLNQGTRSRAEADYEQLVRRQLTVHNQIVLDVRVAHARYAQARAEYDVLATRVRPEVEAAIARAQRAYQAGATTYLLALEATRQRIDTDFRQAQLRADLVRAWAELERSVGRRLPTGPDLVVPPPPLAPGDGSEPPLPAPPPNGKTR